MRQSCTMKYALINLQLVTTNYFQVKVNQASYSLREHRTFILSECTTETCENSFLISYIVCLQYLQTRYNFVSYCVKKLDTCLSICDFVPVLKL